MSSVEPRSPRRALPALAAALILAIPAVVQGQVRGQGLEGGRLLGEKFLLVRGATVIDGTGGLPREDASVLIRNGVIEFVGRVEDMTVPEGTEIVDARDGWLLPGFIDVHAHPHDTTAIEAFLAAGITTVRSPGSPVRDGIDYQKATNGGDITGPRIVSAGPAIDAPPGRWPGSVLVRTEEEARAAVREQAEAGAELIALQAHLSPQLVAASVDQAHELDLPVTGDLVRTSWTEAVRAGIDHLSHIVSRNPDLLSPGARRAYRRDVSEGLAHPYYRWLEALDLEGPQVDAMLGALLAGDVSVAPTLALTEAVLFCSDPRYVAELRELSGLDLPASGEGPPELEKCVAETWPEDYLARARAAWPKALALVRLLHEQGVRITAGSAAPFGRFPAGASYHRELELLSRAGLSNRDVLRIATANGAVVLGELHETGTIEPGKRADMVLLGSDPLRDIRNTRDVEWVMLDAELFRTSGPVNDR